MSSRPYETEVDAAWKWWSSLRPDEMNGRRGDRATLARLRRASNIMDAAAEPAVGDLFRKLGFDRAFAARDLPRAALIAATLALIKSDALKDPRTGHKITLARAIGTPRGGAETTELVTPLRLKRLVAAREPDDLLSAFRRVIAILGQTANVKDVARQLLLWTDDRHADRARTIFSFDYHDAAGAAPNLDAH